MTTTAIYRNNRFRDLCALCDEIARNQCVRCARPLCTDHQHSEDRRCWLCEDQFKAESIAVRPLTTSSTTSAVLGGATALLLAGMFLISPALAAVSFLPLFTCTGLIIADISGAAPHTDKRRHTVKRRRFLRERNQL